MSERDHAASPMADRDARVDDLWRSIADAEPSSALDGALCRAARQALAPPRKPWWMRWRLPVSVAAAAVLGLSLTLRLRDDGGRLRTGEPVGVPPASAPDPAGVSPNVEIDAVRARSDAPARRMAPAAESSGVTSAAPESAARLPEPPPVPQERRAITDRAEADTPAAPAFKAEGARASGSVAADALTKSVAPSPGRAALPSASPTDEALSAEALLERIREARRAGQDGEARRLMAIFTRRFAQLAVPADLSDLRAP